MVRIVLGLVLMILLASCNEEVRDIDFDKAQFEANREIWRSQGILNYEFTYSLCCDEPIEFVITVRNDQVTEVQGPGISDPDDPNAPNPITINQLFDEIELLATNPGDPSVTPSFYLLGIDITYDSQYLFPSDVTFNYHNPDERALNFSWSIESFAPE